MHVDFLLVLAHQEHATSITSLLYSIANALRLLFGKMVEYANHTFTWY